MTGTTGVAGTTGWGESGVDVAILAVLTFDTGGRAGKATVRLTVAVELPPLPSLIV